MINSYWFGNGNRYLARIHETDEILAAPVFKTIYNAVLFRIRNSSDDIRHIEFWAYYNLENPVFTIDVVGEPHNRLDYVIKSAKNGNECRIFNLAN